MGLTNKRRIFIPKNTNNIRVYSAFVTNSNKRFSEEFAFRINLDNGKMFRSLQYNLDKKGWTSFLPRDMAANLFNVMISADSTMELQIRMSTGAEDVTVKYINLQLDSSLTVSSTIENPDNIPGLYIYYEASDSIKNGTNISQLTDKSGNNIHAVQAFAADQPAFTETDSDFNGKASITFDGTSDFLQTDSFPTALSQPNTIIMVYKNTTDGSGAYFDGLSSNGRQILTYDNSNSRFVFFAGDNKFLTGGTANTNTNMFVARFNGDTSDLYRNGGSPIISGELGDNAMDGLTIGTDFPENDFKDMKMGTFLIYDRLLDDDEINRIGTLFATEYGVSYQNLIPPVQPIEKTIDFTMDISTYVVPVQKTLSSTFDLVVITAPVQPIVRTEEFTANIVIAPTPSTERTTSFTSDITTGEAPYNPGTISGLYIRYGADDVEVSNTLVSSFNDKIASRDATQAALARRPVLIPSDPDFNNKPSVLFNGNTDFVRTAAFPAQSQPNTIVLIFKRQISSPRTAFFYAGISRNNRNRLGVRSNGSDGGTEYTINSGMTQSGGLVDTNTHISVIRYNSPNTTSYIDGGTSHILGGNTGTETVTGFTIGGNWNDRGNSIIKIAEFYMWNRQLTDAEVNQIGNGLSTTYGTTWTDI